MTYLSRLILNPISRYVQRDLADVFQMHRTILSGFPQTEDRKKKARESFDVLFRIDFLPQSQMLILLIQSDQEPRWNNLASDYLNMNISEPNPAIKSIDNIIEQLQNKMFLNFKLRANPTRKIKNDKKNGARVPITDAAKIIEWLKRKGLDGGFKVFSVISSPEPMKTGFKKNNDLNSTKKPVSSEILHSFHHDLTFNGVVFSGTLQISDKIKFSETIKKGIGSGKAFGYGLLSIATVHNC